MCVTNTRLSTICGHTATHTTLCPKNTSPNSFLSFLRTCTPTTHSVIIYEICHSCRTFWRAYGITEPSAMKRTIVYRESHNYYGPLSPHAYRSDRTPVLVPDGELERNVHVQVQVPKEVRKELEEQELGEFKARWKFAESGEAIEDPDSSIRPTTASSSKTIWPTFAKQFRDAQVSAGNLSIRLAHPETPVPEDDIADQMIHPTEFDDLDSPVSTGGFEGQELDWTSPPIPLADLEKPLPRPPRPDSPMPGRKFDNQNPERDLPASKFYPRVF